MGIVKALVMRIVKFHLPCCSPNHRYCSQVENNLQLRWTYVKSKYPMHDQCGYGIAGYQMRNIPSLVAKYRYPICLICCFSYLAS